MNKNKIKKQGGFSIVELLVVIAVITVLTLAIYSGKDAIYAKNNRSLVQKELQIYFPNAVLECNIYYRTLIGCDKDRIVELSALQNTNTVFGDTWSVVDSANEIVVTYPLTSADNAIKQCLNLKAALDNMSKISATCTGSILAVTYKR